MAEITDKQSLRWAHYTAKAHLEMYQRRLEDTERALSNLPDLGSDRSRSLRESTVRQIVMRLQNLKFEADKLRKKIAGMEMHVRNFARLAEIEEESAGG